MSKTRNVRLRRKSAFAALVLGSVYQLGFIETCDDRLIAISRQIDPCGTILSNCNPGDLEVSRAEVGDFCVDPACTVPGQCGTGLQPLGTITNICP